VSRATVGRACRYRGGVTVKAQVRRLLSRIPGALPVARLTLETIRVCLRYRVTGLASEAGFFALLSLPPLLLGLFGGVGYVGQWLGADTVEAITRGIQAWAKTFLTGEVISDLLVPTVDDVFKSGRFDLISVGFLLSLWSGSRALNVFVDTISIMYGQSGVRGIVRTRALSFTLYLLSLLLGVVVIPLVLIGPTWLGQILPAQVDFLRWLYWPVVTVLAVMSLTTLFHVSTPRRSPWLRDLPGAALTLVMWALASFFVRVTIAKSLNGTSIYGPLSAPIVLLIWLYALAIAVLIGAALNAAIRNLWPAEEFHFRAMLRAAVFGRREEQPRPPAPVSPPAYARGKRPLTPLPEEPADGVRSQRSGDGPDGGRKVRGARVSSEASAEESADGLAEGSIDNAAGRGDGPAGRGDRAGDGGDRAGDGGRRRARRGGRRQGDGAEKPAGLAPDGRFGDGRRDRLMSLRTHSGE
jgi:membrane protein